MAFVVGFGLGGAFIFVSADGAEFFTFSDFRGLALRAETDGFGHEAGFDAIFVSAFTEF